VSSKTHGSSQKAALCFQALRIKAKEVKYLICRTAGVRTAQGFGHESRGAGNQHLTPVSAVGKKRPQNLVNLQD